MQVANTCMFMYFYLLRKLCFGTPNNKQASVKKQKPSETYGVLLCFLQRNKSAVFTNWQIIHEALAV